MRTWGGRRAQELVARVLQAKGRVCHLCLLPGANSADHNPPRSALVAAGVANPDAMRFLFPSHLLCNVTRKDRPIDQALRDECREKMLAAHRVRPARSARFAQLRASSVD